MTTATDAYEELGIYDETWACVAIMPRRDAQKYAFDLAASGCPVRIMRDPDGKRWHIAVQGGLKGSPLAWIVNLRGEPYDPDTCVGGDGQHPMVCE